jgi:hypothetical protein
MTRYNIGYGVVLLQLPLPPMINQRTRNVGFAAERAFGLGGNLAFYFSVSTSVACLMKFLVHDLLCICGVPLFSFAVFFSYVRFLALTVGMNVGATQSRRGLGY